MYLWGLFGFLKAAAVVLFWTIHFPEQLPDGWAVGAAWSALEAINLHNAPVEGQFILGFLFGVVGEIAIGFAFAALVWWTYSFYLPHPETPRILAPIHRYAISVLLSACLLGIANHLASLRPSACFDCLTPHGIPFTYFHEGGFAGGEGFVWSGVLGNTLVVVATGAIMAWAWNRLAQRHLLSRPLHFDS